MVSERYASVGGPKGIVKNSGRAGPAEHVDTMINKGCYNPTPKAGTRWSMYSYNMELAEDKPVKSSKSGPVTGFEYSKAVKYLGNLLLTLHAELGAAQDRLACDSVDYVGNSVDDGDRRPGRAAAERRRPADLLKSKWTATNNYLKKCAGANDEPGRAIQAKNCGDFLHGL